MRFCVDLLEGLKSQLKYVSVILCSNRKVWLWRHLEYCRIWTILRVFAARSSLYPIGLWGGGSGTTSRRDSFAFPCESWSLAPTWASSWKRSPPSLPSPEYEVHILSPFCPGGETLRRFAFEGLWELGGGGGGERIGFMDIREFLNSYPSVNMLSNRTGTAFKSAVTQIHKVRSGGESNIH